MYCLKRIAAKFTAGVALLLTLSLQPYLMASSKCESKSHRCSIGCGESTDSSRCCEKVCSSNAYVQEGCIFVPDRTETIIDPSTCSPTPEYVPGANLYYRVQGEGHENSPTIVFIPPIEGTSDVWRCQQEEFSKCYRTIAIDLRGTGRSDVTSPYSIHYTHQLFANDIYAMLQDPALNVTQNIVLVGNAVGGSIGIVYATLHPSQVKKLVLVNSSPGLYVVNDCAVDPACDPSIACGGDASCCNPSNCQPICWPYPAYTMSQIYDNLNTVECQDEFCYETCVYPGCDDCFRQTAYNYFSWNLPLTVFNEDCKCGPLANAQAQGAQAATQLVVNGVWQNIIFNTLTQDLRPLLPYVRAKTLVCIGTLDAQVPNGAGIFLNNHIKHSKLAKFEGKGNELEVTAYKQFNKVLDKFITSKEFPCFVDVPDRGCCVCPLVKPEPFIPSCAQDVQ